MVNKQVAWTSTLEFTRGMNEHTVKEWVAWVSITGANERY